MKQKNLNLTLLLFCMIVGMGSAWGEEYSFTIQTSDFNTTSYAANNGSHDFTATCTTDASKTMTVSCTTNQIMQSSSVMQWQKSNGYIYNTTNLGTIKSVTVNSSAGTFTTNYGTTEHPTSGTTVGNGFFTVKVGGATGKTSSVVVVFETSSSEPKEPCSVTLSDDSSILTEKTGGAGVILPARDGNETYSFVGWSTTNLGSEETTTKPEVFVAGTYKPNANVTLYPIYERTEGTAFTATSNNLSASTTDYQILESGKSARYKISAKNNYSNPLRVYTNNTLTIDASRDYNVTKVVLEGSDKSNPVTNLTLKSGQSGDTTVEDGKVIWTGNAQEVVFTASLAQARVSTITVTYCGSNIYYYVSELPEVLPLDHITATNPTKTLYKVGETFSTEGMTVTAYYEDTAEGKNVTIYTYNNNPLTADDNKVTISYTENGVTKTADVDIDVVALDKIEVTTPPTKTEYTEGEDFDATGMEVTATWGTEVGKTISEVVDATTDGSNLQPGTTSITLSYTHEGITKTVTQEIKVNAIPTYTVTIETPENGTLVVKNGDAVISTGDEVKNGATLTITATPNDGYKYKNWQYKEGTNSWKTKYTNYEYTVNGADVSFRANFELIPTYEVTWSINGQVQTTTVREGESITTPTVESIDEYNFVGWSTAEIPEEVTEEPTYVSVSSGEYAPTADITMYAVYERIEADNSNNKNYVLSYDNSDMPLKYEDTTITIDDAKFHLSYVGRFEDYSTKELYKYFQMKKPESDGSKTGTIWVDENFGHCVNSIKVNFNEGNSATAIVKVIYGENEVTLSNNSNTCNLNGASIFEINTSSADLVVKINSIEFNCTSGTSYYTTAPLGMMTITLNPACYDEEDDNKVYGTFSSSKAFVVPSNLTVAEVGISNDILNVESYNTGDIVPANRGVMVSAAEGGSYKVYVAKDGTSVLGSDNCLRPSGDEGITVEAMAAADANCTYYRLTMHEGTQIGYWWGAENGAAFNLGANKAYLAVPSGTSVKANLWFGGVETSISAPEALNAENGVIYNLNGQRVSSATKGIYIKNGKKYFVK